MSALFSNFLIGALFRLSGIARNPRQFFAKKVQFFFAMEKVHDAPKISNNFRVGNDYK
jgi:hypothetical protein